jgi:signal transduction histidine kinase
MIAFAIRGSFRARLIAGAIIWIAVGIGASWWVLSEMFRGHAISEFVDELDHHATELANLLETDASGRLSVRVPLSDHRFLTPKSGYYWQAELPNGQRLTSASLGSARLELRRDFTHAGEQKERRIDGPTGKLLLLERVVRLPAGANLAAGTAPPGDIARVAVGTDQRLLDEFMGSFRRTLGMSLGMIAIGLIAAAFAQIAYGLRPLRRIRQALQAVQRGDAQRLPGDLPEEVAPLAANVNALLDAKEAMIRHARVQAGNLAHALKTPLAILQEEGRRLQAAGQDGRQVMEQCDRMRRQIDYQLAKARAAASRMGNFGATRLAPALTSIAATVERLYRDRDLHFDVAAPPADTVVMCEAEDLDEILGNIIENAAKWARSRIRVTVDAGPTIVHITVEDDGPGMAVEARERVFEAGERLDEQTPGTGLGLAIVRDVTTLYGGRCWIDTATLGGAAVHVELPVPGH